MTDDADNQEKPLSLCRKPWDWLLTNSHQDKPPLWTSDHPPACSGAFTEDITALRLQEGIPGHRYSTTELLALILESHTHSGV